MAFAAYRYQVNSQFIQSCFLCHRPNLSNFDFSLHCCNQGECSKPGLVWFLYVYSLHLILIPPSLVGSACVFIFGEKLRHWEFTVLFYSTSCFRGWASTTAVWLEEHCLRPSLLLLQDVFRSLPAASLHLFFNFGEAVYRAARLQLFCMQCTPDAVQLCVVAQRVTPRVLGRLGKRSSIGFHSKPVPRQYVLISGLIITCTCKFISFDGFLPISSSFLCSKSRFSWSFGNSGKTAVKGHGWDGSRYCCNNSTVCVFIKTLCVCVYSKYCNQMSLLTVSPWSQ